jgi:hypothetical protein
MTMVSRYFKIDFKIGKRKIFSAKDVNFEGKAYILYMRLRSTSQYDLNINKDVMTPQSYPLLVFLGNTARGRFFNPQNPP